jgi:hypothetical protein
MSEGFDNTPQGRETIALLRKHAPPPVDARAGAQAVLARLERPSGRLVMFRWLAPLTAAAAVLVVTLLILQQGHTPPPSRTAPPIADVPVPDTTAARSEREYPEVVARVRGVSGDGLLISAGAKDGLRVGDVLHGPNGVEARVSAVGIFDARVTAAGLPRGTELRVDVRTEAQRRAARFAEFGGDPGAFFEFGALLTPLQPGEARILGIADGRALRVDEVITALLKDPDGDPVPTLAARLGLQPGDVMYEANGAATGSFNDLATALGWSHTQQQHHMRIIRNSRQLDLNLR